MPCDAGLYNTQAKQSVCQQCDAGYHCSPGGVIDFALGKFYPFEGLHACANSSKGIRTWVHLAASAQSDYVGGVVKDSDGYVYVAGSTDGEVMNDVLREGQGFDAFIVKYTRAGDVIWTMFLGNEGRDDYSNGIAADGVGGIFVVMKTFVPEILANASGPNATIVTESFVYASLVKVLDCGTKEWTVHLGKTSPTEMPFISAAGVHVFVLATNELNETKVYSYYDNGTLAWSLTLGFLEADSPKGLQVSPDGFGFAVGETNRNGTVDVLVVKFVFESDAPSVAWTRLVGTSSEDVVRGITIDAVGNPLITGFTGTKNDIRVDGTVVLFGTTLFGNDSISVTPWDQMTEDLGGLDAFVFRLGSSTGNLVWSALVGSPGNDGGNDVSLDENGNLYVLGFTTYGSHAGRAGFVENATALQDVSSHDLFLTKYGRDLERQWSRVLRTGSSLTEGRIDASGDGVVIAGNSVGNIDALTGGDLVSPGGADVAVAYYSSSADCTGQSVDGDFDCPRGFFCRAGIVNLEEGRCPLGTYNNRTGLENESQCAQCPAGLFCGETGLSEPSGICRGGYYCEAGEINSTGRGRCPTGFFCPP